MEQEKIKQVFNMFKNKKRLFGKECTLNDI
jgi:hypothetical protein